MHVSTEIFNLVFREAATAAGLWVALQQLFQDNIDARTNLIHTELRNTVQGDSSLSVYCQRLRSIADELRELGDPVEDRQLINILLIRLSEQFDKQASFIPMMRPQPTFAEVRSILQWADCAQTNKDTRPQLFAAVPRGPAPAAPPAGSPSPAVPSSSTAPAPPPGWRPSPNYRGKNPIYRPPSTRSAPTPPPSPAPSTPPAATPGRPPNDPWTGLVQAWPMPWSAPAPLGAPPAYTGAWQPGVRPHTGARGFLMPRQPAHAYHAAPTYGAPYYADGGHYYTPSPALLSSPSYQPALLPTPPAAAPPSRD